MIPRLAPTWWQAAWRAVLIGLAVLLVGGAMYLVNGAPAPRRRYPRNEIARFSPTLGHGLLQLAGETALVVGLAWFARRKLKIRL